LFDVKEAETSRPVTARLWLRAETAEAHAEVDRLFGRFDLTTAAGYAAMLTAHAVALMPVEDWLDRHAAPTVADWPERRRGGALRSDLAALGYQVPVGEAFHGTSAPAALAGILYVLEGSRFGGRVIARSLPPSLPHAYLAPAVAPSWPAFVGWLDSVVADAASRAEAARAARAVFTRFHEVGRTRLGHAA